MIALEEVEADPQAPRSSTEAIKCELRIDGVYGPATAKALAAEPKLTVK
jgi:hypothetical protein